MVLWPKKESEAWEAGFHHDVTQHWRKDFGDAEMLLNVLDGCCDGQKLATIC